MPRFVLLIYKIYSAVGKYIQSWSAECQHIFQAFPLIFVVAYRNCLKLILYTIYIVGGVRIGKMLGNPQNVSEEVRAKNINLSITGLIQLMNATIDFNQVSITEYQPLHHRSYTTDECHDRLQPGQYNRISTSPSPVLYNWWMPP